MASVTVAAAASAGVGSRSSPPGLTAGPPPQKRKSPVQARSQLTKLPVVPGGRGDVTARAAVALQRFVEPDLPERIVIHSERLKRQAVSPQTTQFGDLGAPEDAERRRAKRAPGEAAVRVDGSGRTERSPKMCAPATTSGRNDEGLPRGRQRSDDCARRRPARKPTARSLASWRGKPPCGARPSGKTRKKTAEKPGDHAGTHEYYVNTEISKPSTPMRSYYKPSDDGIPYSHKRYEGADMEKSPHWRHHRSMERTSLEGNSRNRVKIARMLRGEGSFPERHQLDHLDDDQQRLLKVAMREVGVEKVTDVAGEGSDRIAECGLGPVDATGLPNSARSEAPTTDWRGRPELSTCAASIFRRTSRRCGAEIDTPRAASGGSRASKGFPTVDVVSADLSASGVHAAEPALLWTADDFSLRSRLCEINLKEDALRRYLEEMLYKHERKDERGKKLRKNRYKYEYVRLRELLRAHVGQAGRPPLRRALMAPPIEIDCRGRATTCTRFVRDSPRKYGNFTALPQIVR